MNYIECVLEDDQSSSINYENLYLNTESNMPPSSVGNFNDRINTMENLNFEENSSQANLNLFYTNTEENIVLRNATVFSRHQNQNPNQINSFNNNNGILNNNNNNNENENLHLINQNAQATEQPKPCYVCEASVIEYYFICGNGCCMDCLQSHIQSVLEKYKQKVFSEKIKFVCVGSCKCVIDASDIIDKVINLSPALHELHNDVLFKMHLAQAKDIISCPKSTCANSGFYSMNALSSPCLECSTCGTKIANPANQQIFSADFFSSLFENLKFSNFKSYVLKTFTTKYCNKCQSPIEKVDGCKHIECNRCEYSFCWKCTSDWSTHSQTACMGIFANPFDDNDRPDFFFMVCFYLTVICILKFISGFYVLFKLYYFFMAILFGAGIILNIFTTAGLIDLLRKYRIKTVLIPAVLFALFEGILYYFNLHPLSEKVYFYVQVGSNTLVSAVMGILYLRKRR